MNNLQVDGPAARRCRTSFFTRRVEAGMQTSHSTAQHSGTEWMEQERVFHQRLDPEAVRVVPDPDGRLMNRRRTNLSQRVAELKARRRMPRVCLYAFAVHSRVPTRSWEEARAFAVREGWQVGSEQTFVDDYGPTTPMLRSGWVQVRRQVRSGFADGVVALTQSAIAPGRDEYESQLRWFAEHFGFIALVHPETPEALR